jgi:hypothetical protein
MPPTNDNGEWEMVMYVGGATFPSDVAPRDGWADVPAARQDEFERLVLQLRPLNLWIVTLVNYVPGGGGGSGIFDGSFDASFN